MPRLGAAGARAASSQSQTSRTAPAPPGRRVRRCAIASGDRVRVGDRDRQADLRQQRHVGLIVADAGALGAPGSQAVASSCASTGALSSTPWCRWRIPSSSQRRATAGDSRPEITATAMPAASTALMP